MLGADLAPALNNHMNGVFFARARLPLVGCLGFAARRMFVLAAERASFGRRHGGADAMRHEPCGAVAEAELAL